MEKIHAACTMDWSIELEKGLRSKKPGESVEAILQIGHRLKQWNVESQLSKAAYDMFGLMPLEDRLFANTILLRLTEAFRLGDKLIKLSVVEVFLSEFRHRKERRNKNNGILSNSMVENPLELLSRVKTVFDFGDVETRSFCLILFGCWADFAKDNTDIRYLILMSLASSDVVEAKASIFAAGCFCELVEDFAYVFLKMLMDLVTSPNTADAVRLAGVRAISRIGYSPSVADTAYKLGKKFVLESSEEFLAAMLISLSKLASRWPLLVSDQAKLLLSYITRGTALKLQTTAIRCLCSIFAKGAGHCVVSVDMMKSLICFVDEPQISSSTQFEVLWILHQVLMYTLPNLFNTNVVEMSKLLIIIESASLSPFRANRHLAMRIYINIAGKLRGISEIDSCGMLYDSLPPKAVTLIMKKLTSVLKQVVDSGETQVVQESQYLFNLLICLVEEHSDLSVLVLDNMQSLIKAMITVFDRAMPTMRSCSLAQERMNSKVKKNTSSQLKFVIYLYRFMVDFIEILNKTGATNTEIFQKIKLLVSHVQKSSSFDWYTHSLYSLLLHSYIVWDYVTIENTETCTPDGYLCRSNLVEQENLSLLCVKKMLVQKDNWSTYKSGLFAACQGSWLMADFIFEQLTTKVQSNSCYHWLNFLAQFAHSEKELQFLLLPKFSSILVNTVEDNKTISMSARNDYNENLVSAYCTIRSSKEALEALSSEGFYFQKWFSNIRFDVLEIVLNMLEILVSFSFYQDKIDVQSPAKSQQVNTLVLFLSQRSYRLMRLAQQCDLIVTSFVGMHRKSLEAISALALSCEILAFSTGFACLISDVSPSEIITEKGLEKPEYISPAMVIESLITRLTHVDHETCRKLKCLLKDAGESKRHVQILRRNQMSCGASELRKVLRVCESAVDGASYLQREEKSVQSDERLLINTKSGLQLLANTIRKWTHVPFCTPKSFFKLRPCIGSELFAINNDLRNSDSISVLPGFHLSLNLCLQLKNMPSDFQIKRNKLYCILYCKVSFATPSSSKETEGQTCFGHRGWDADGMLDLNDKLLHYATEREKKSSRKHCIDTDKEVGAAKAFVTIEPNEGGQGFSTCLLDVSNFPSGSYQIRWLSCCIDSQGSYWSFLPLNAGLVFTVQKSHTLK